MVSHGFKYLKKIKTIEETDEYKQVKKVSDLINKIKNEQKKNITHGEIQTKLPNFAHFDIDTLVCVNSPDNKIYEYYHTDTKKNGHN